jgi:MoaA/NifB/PqqE/SkfB family radical SAM enzyme
VSDPGSQTGWWRVKSRALAAARPLHAYCELTYRCNWRCVFCYNPRHHDRRGLTTPEWMDVVDELHALGTLTVTLTGGEPMAHPGFLAIAGKVRDRSLAFRVLTNGSLITSEIAAALAELQPLGVELSLHGARAETHDRTTGTVGSFEALRRGLERLRAHGLPVVLKTPLTSINEPEIEAIVALVEGWGLPHSLDATLTPRDDGDRAPLAFRASRDGVKRMYGLVARQGKLPEAGRDPGGVSCGLGRLTLAVDPEGHVFPCLQWRQHPLGNVRDAPLRELWFGSPVRAAAAEVARDANDALREKGGALARFPFCPAVAAQRTGDPLTPDEDHAAQAAIVDRLRSSAP